MTEGGETPKISKFDNLLASLKRAVKRSQEEGRETVEETPAIDDYLERKKKEAGSFPPEKRT